MTTQSDASGFESWKPVGTTLSGGVLYYPLYALPVRRVFELSRMIKHEELMEELVEWSPELGPLLFMSHQWTSFSEPDPTEKQFECVQQACFNLSQLDETASGGGFYAEWQDETDR